MTASRDGTVRRWERTTWSPLGEPLRGPFGAVRAVALTPDGDLIVTACQDGTVRRWNRTAGTPFGQPLRGHDSPVQSLAIGPEGREFASGGPDGTVRRWDRGADRPARAPLVAGAPVRCVLLTGDGEITAACSNGTLHRWDRTGQRIGAALPAHATAGLTALTVRIARAVPGGAPPRGRVTFTADGVSLGTVLLDELGLATLRTAAPPEGDQEIVVAYEGDDAHCPSMTTLHVRGGSRTL
ncbi:Ig-like domain repeat protein [Streptomyces sp. TE33382]